MNTLQIEGGRLVDFATLPEFQPQSSILLKAIIRKGSLSPDGFQRYRAVRFLFGIGRSEVVTKEELLLNV